MIDFDNVEAVDFDYSDDDVAVRNVYPCRVIESDGSVLVVIGKESVFGPPWRRTFRRQRNGRFGSGRLTLRAVGDQSILPWTADE